jgi:hypothetical protein
MHQPRQLKSFLTLGCRHTDSKRGNGTLLIAQRMKNRRRGIDGTRTSFLAIGPRAKLYVAIGTIGLKGEDSYNQG